MKSIKNGYKLQFFHRPPHFNGVLMSTVWERNASVLREEIHNILAKRAVDTVPLADRESGFYSRYFLVPKKDGGLRPILDLRPLNRALLKRSFKMITLRQILSHIRPRDWFISVDLNDAYFHIQVAPHHRSFLRFAFKGIAYQFSVLPFGLCLAPRTFTKCMEAALSPLKQSGMHILNYLDDWLVLAQSESALLSDKLRLRNHLQSLGLIVNMQKSMLVPSRNISFLGVELNSIDMRVRLSEECSQKLISSLAVFKLGHSPPLKCLHMRPLQLWLKSQVPESAWRTGTLRIKGHLALKCFLPDILHRHVLIRTDSMTVVVFINHQGQIDTSSPSGQYMSPDA